MTMVPDRLGAIVTGEIMMTRLSLTALLLAGCSVSFNDDTGGPGTSGGASTAQDTTGTTAQGSDTSASSATTEPAPTSTGGPDDSEAGGNSASQADSSGSTSTGSTSTGTDSTGSTDGTTGGCMGVTGQAPVSIGSAEDPETAGAYALLAKTAITNATGSVISGGHVGLSPAAASFITGFSLVIDASGTFATSPSVVAPGKVYAADYKVPTPVSLTTAVLTMQTAYIDAAGRVPTDYLNLGDGDIGGLTLAPGLYTWGSTVTIAADVTIEGCPDDVWIFQISDDLDISAAKQVILAGGARAENVFWQVAGQATIHADAHFEGVILAKTAITLQTGASLHGRALAQTMIALDDNAITAP